MSEINESKIEDKAEGQNGVPVEIIREASAEAAKEIGKSSEKSWIAAGFKSRSEWRASKSSGKAKKPAKQKASAASKPKGKKPAKAKVKAAAKSAAKKPAKKARKAKIKAKSKLKTVPKRHVKLAAKSAKSKLAKRKKPAPPKKGSVHDGALKPVPLAELSTNVKKVFLSVKPGKTALLAEIEAKAFPSLPHKKASSRTRNQLRFLRVHKMFRLLGDGQYKRIA